jgi:hypothetical protein
MENLAQTNKNLRRNRRAESTLGRAGGYAEYKDNKVYEAGRIGIGGGGIIGGVGRGGGGGGGGGGAGGGEGGRGDSPLTRMAAELLLLELRLTV